MNEIQGTAGGRGHVRAVFSERCRGFAAPLDLVRVHLRAIGRLIERMDSELRALEMRGRVRGAFADYLVSDAAPCELLEAEMVACWPWNQAGRAAFAFSGRREWHQIGINRLCVTGSRSPIEAGYRDMAGGPLDAPDCLPAGACTRAVAAYGGCGSVVLREPVEESAPAFVAGRFWRGFVAETNTGRSGPAGLIVDNEAVRYGFAVDCLDAPEFMAAGSMHWLACEIGSGGFVGQQLAMRGAL